MIPVVVRVRPPRGDLADRTRPLPRHRPAHEAPTLPIRVDRRIPLPEWMHAGGGVGLAVVACAVLGAVLPLVALTVYAFVAAFGGL